MASIFNSQYLKNLNNLYAKTDNSYFVNTLFKKFGVSNGAIVSVFDNTGIAGFKFHIPQREQVTMSNEVTTHYVEDNTPVQDHIVRKPIQITLDGFQGDFFYSNHKIESALANVTPIMNLVEPFLPQLSNITSQIKNKAINKIASQKENAISQNNLLIGGVQSNEFNIVNKVINYKNLFQIFQDLYKIKSAQTRAFIYLEALWKSQMLFTIETTWRRYENMVITNLKPMRDNNADITDFSVTFQEVRFTQTLTTSANNTGRTSIQKENIVKKGIDKGKEVSVETDYATENQTAYNLDDKYWWLQDV